MKIPRISRITLGVMLLAGGLGRLDGQTTTTILQTDFGSLANNLPAGYTAGTVVSGGTGNLTVENTTNQLFIGADGGGNLQFTSQKNQGNPGFGVYQTIANGASYAQLTGSISFSFLTFGSNIPSTNFAITNSSFGVTSASQSSMQFGVNGSTGLFTFTNAPTVTLTAGDDYTVSFTIDYTNKSQNTVSFTLTDTTSSSVVLTATGINTRAASITPASFFIASSGGTTSTGNPAYLDVSAMSLNGVSAIPEPATCAVLLSLGALGFCWWRRHGAATRS